MRLTLHTSVAAPDPAGVLAAFTEPLFRALAPPFPRLHVQRFDGSQPGDEIAIELRWGLFRQHWTSLITDADASPSEAWFIDEGQRLPWPLRRWRHRHLVARRRDGHPGTIITDEVSFSTGNAVLNAILYPMLWAQFAYRRPIYRRWFGTPAE